MCVNGNKNGSFTVALVNNAQLRSMAGRFLVLESRQVMSHICPLKVAQRVCGTRRQGCSASSNIHLRQERLTLTLLSVWLQQNLLQRFRRK